MIVRAALGLARERPNAQQKRSRPLERPGQSEACPRSQSPARPGARCALPRPPVACTFRGTLRFAPATRRVLVPGHASLCPGHPSRASSRARCALPRPPVACEFQGTLRFAPATRRVHVPGHASLCPGHPSRASSGARFALPRPPVACKFRGTLRFAPATRRVQVPGHAALCPGHRLSLSGRNSGNDTWPVRWSAGRPLLGRRGARPSPALRAPSPRGGERERGPPLASALSASTMAMDAQRMLLANHQGALH
jgi:hypothetical protein